LKKGYKEKIENLPHENFVAFYAVWRYYWILEKKFKMKRTKINFYIVFSVVGLLISLSVCTLMFFQFRNFTEDSYFGTLKNVAVMVEKQYPVLYNIDSMKEGFLNDEDWIWDIHNEWVDIKKAFGLAYIYYMERVGTEYLEIMDTYYTRDMGSGWLGSEVWEDDPVPEGVDEAWDTQEITYSPEPSVEEQWGTVVSAYFPVVRNGRTIGILGVDYDISYVKSLENRILILLIFSFVASAAVTVLLAFLGSRSVLISIEERERIANEANERREEIEDLMKELRATMDSKSTFMIAISNEMSTPVGNIIKLSSAMMKENDVTETRRKYLQVVNDSGVTLHNVINDILDINKIEAGRIKIHYNEYKLPNLISDITTMYASIVENSLIHFELNISNNLPLKLLGDEMRMKHICSRLLLNAFKFTARGTITFSVSCQWEDEYVWLIIKIKDTGYGIREKDLAHVFSGYENIDVAGKVRSGGTGLGLHIIERITKMMNGTITVASEYGKGSIFTLRLYQKALSKELIDPQAVQMLKNFQYTKA